MAERISESKRASRVIVDLEAITGNARYFRSIISPGSHLMAVVKADAYGHGAVPVARAALSGGADWLGVATVDEGVVLRAAEGGTPILVLGPVDPAEIAAAVASNLTLAIGDPRFAPLVGRVAATLKRVAGVHLKIDTGMHRFGAMPDEAVTLARRVAANPWLRLEGLFTHFAAADGEDEEMTARQAAIFEAVAETLAASGLRPRLLHAANSAAALRWRRYDYDLVRVGIALYGLPPAAWRVLPEAVRPALRVVSRVARVARLRAGDGVSYGHTYRAAGDETIALVPIGYADGYPRALSNRGWMAVGGVRAPVRGRICMDQTVIGLPAGARVAAGDLVEVMGGAGPSLAEVASMIDTIPYEIATGLGRRLSRYYERQRARE